MLPAKGCPVFARSIASENCGVEIWIPFFVRLPLTTDAACGPRWVLPAGQAVDPTILPLPS